MGNKLELNWIGKENNLKIEPRILIKDPSKSYGLSDTGNMIIHGDNLLALKALEQEYAGSVKCIYIDPPYNTGNAFEHYDDNLEHSIWLNLIFERIKILYKLLKNDGIFWVSIDDRECHYLKVICDEIFGRSSFIADITYERSGSAGLGQGGVFVNNSEHILVYKKGDLIINDVLGSTKLEIKTMKRYNKVLNKVGERELVEEFISKSNGKSVKIYKHKNFEINTISLKGVNNKDQELKIREEFLLNFDKLFRTNNVQKENEFQNDLLSKMDKKYLYTVDYVPSRGKYKDKLTTLYYFNAELFAWLKDTSFIEDGQIMKTNKLTTVWSHADIPKADLANEGKVDFPRSKKPEQLMKRIIELSTDEGDIVLDSFLGSGTTAAVAHKLKRRYIGIELGDHAYTHCLPRLKSVIDGTDKGGVTKSTGWVSGGGFDFYELAPTLILLDNFGNEIINPDYNSEMLAQAVAKYENFIFNPHNEIFWKQAQASENAFLYTTTQHLTFEYVNSIFQEMKENEYLIICCKSYDSTIQKQFKKITIKKIPNSILKNCEFGIENYNLSSFNEPGFDNDDFLEGDDDE